MDVTISRCTGTEAPHPAAEAWAQLRPEQPPPDRIEAVRAKRKDKSIIFRLDGVGPHGLRVIAKRCRRSTAEVERLIYQDVLSGVPVSSPTYYGYVEDNDSGFAWLFLGDAGGTEYSPANAGHCRLAAEWLGCLAAARLRPDVRARLPNRDVQHYMNDTVATRARILAQRTSPRLTADDRVVLDALVRCCDTLTSHQAELEAICGRVPVTVVHGDFVGKNVHVRVNAEGTVLLPFDWETAGVGVPAVDIAQFTRETFAPGIDVYWSQVRDQWPWIAEGELRQLAAIGRIFRVVNVISWETWNLEYDWVEASIRVLRAHAHRLADSLVAVGWDA
jgi:hypothetical protein